MKPKPYHRTILPYSAFLNRSGYWNNAYGNITSMPHINTLAYDQDDQLKVAIFPTTGYMAFYCYDSAGERVRKVVHKPGGIVEQHLYLGGYEIFRKTVGGTLNLERETLTISDDQKAIVRIETKKVENGYTITPVSNQRYQYDNHLGSACLELDSTAAIISYEEYHPFGTTSYRAGSSETEVSLKRYKYCGKERDEETGLYYYGARYYAAWIGRFVTVDPLQFKYPQLTPFNYAGNKSITHIDIDGMQGTGDQQRDNIAYEKDIPGVEIKADKIATDKVSGIAKVWECIQGLGDVIKNGWNKLTKAESTNNGSQTRNNKSPIPEKEKSNLFIDGIQFTSKNPLGSGDARVARVEVESVDADPILGVINATIGASMTKPTIPTLRAMDVIVSGISIVKDINSQENEVSSEKEKTSQRNPNMKIQLFYETTTRSGLLGQYESTSGGVIVISLKDSAKVATKIINNESPPKSPNGKFEK